MVMFPMCVHDTFDISQLLLTSICFYLLARTLKGNPTEEGFCQLKGMQLCLNTVCRSRRKNVAHFLWPRRHLAVLRFTNHYYRAAEYASSRP